jgi:hypothetical protein
MVVIGVTIEIKGAAGQLGGSRCRTRHLCDSTVVGSVATGSGQPFGER